MRTPSTINDDVLNSPDTSSVTAREVRYAHCFRINSVDVPIPSSWQVDPKILTRDAKREVASGKLKAPYVATTYTITWTYKYLSYNDYQTLRQAYIDRCTTNKNIKFNVATLDSNRKNVVFCTKAYTEDGFTAPLYRVDPITGEQYYKDVKFTIVSVGGYDQWTNFFVTKQNFQSTGDSTFNYGNYGTRIDNIRKNKQSSPYYNIGYTNI